MNLKKIYFARLLFSVLLFVVIIGNTTYNVVLADGIGPVLESVLLNQKKFEVGDTVTIKAIVNDNDSGVKSVLAVYQNPSDNRYLYINLKYDSNQDLWVGSYTVQDTDEEGIWSIDHWTLSDNAGNLTGIFTPQTEAEFEIINPDGDGEGPTLESLEISPKSVSVGKSINIKARVSDDKSGVKSVLAVYQNPSDNRYLYINLKYDSNQDLWVGSYTVQDTDEEGIWSIDHWTLSDNAGNLTGIFTPQTEAEFELINPDGDGEGPTLEGLEISPKSVSVGDTINIKARVSDDKSGVKSVLAVYQNPSDNRYLYINLKYDSNQDLWVGSYTVRDTDEEGIWSIDHWTLSDNAGNLTGIFEKDLNADSDFTVQGNSSNENQKIIEENDPIIKYTGTWKEVTQDGNSGGALKISESKGASAEITFSGTGITVLGKRHSLRGLADIYLDNQFVQTIDFSFNTAEFQAELYKKDGLTNGKHTLKIVVKGESAPGRTSKAVALDAFKIIGETTSDDNRFRIVFTDNRIVFTGNWREVTQDGNSGGTLKISESKGASAEITFNGTGITVLGKRHSLRGLADIYLDNQFVQTVDFSSNTAEFQAELYKKDGLTNGEHTLKIVVKGESAPGRTSKAVALDAFEIIGETTSDDNKLVIDDTDNRIVFTGNWREVTQDGNSGGTLKISESKGASAEITFNGTGITVLGKRHSLRGLADIYLDNQFVQTVDFSSNTAEFQAELYKKDGLTNGEHTLKIVVKGESAPGRTSKAVALDAIVIK
ncbi:hypothetical protein [Metabacillus sp. FJAT-53654]|uniref:Uncharacterized protein n=1 Tax=Metabacillus rhizosphaerae TaxID=3117747 RepID=A0ABZ2MWX7_9BACI